MTLLKLWVLYEKSEGQIKSNFIVAFTSHAFLKQQIAVIEVWQLFFFFNKKLNYGLNTFGLIQFVFLLTSSRISAFATYW